MVLTSRPFQLVRQKHGQSLMLSLDQNKNSTKKFGLPNKSLNQMPASFVGKRKCSMGAG